MSNAMLANDLANRQQTTFRIYLEKSRVEQILNPLGENQLPDAQTDPLPHAQVVGYFDSLRIGVFGPWMTKLVAHLAMTLRKNHQRVPRTPKKKNPDNGRLRVAIMANPEKGRSIRYKGNQPHEPPIELDSAQIHNAR